LDADFGDYADGFEVFLDRINRIHWIFVFSVSGLRPVGPTPRRDETEKGQSAFSGEEPTLKRL